LQATRVYLELTDQRGFREAFGAFPGLTVERVARPTAPSYRFWYRTVGEAYHWRDRWDWSDAEIAAHLAQPEISVYVATEHGRFTGWYELRRVADDRSVEIAYFGLAPGTMGRGLGKHLLSCAVRDAWALGATRVWVHTCTFDHPHALHNYRARGFSPYRTESYTVDFAS
jgi:GNAT superfamily N-acetyltransferase